MFPMVVLQSVAPIGLIPLSDILEHQLEVYEPILNASKESIGDQPDCYQSLMRRLSSEGLSVSSPIGKTKVTNGSVSFSRVIILQDRR